jgi:hypothetical protein
LLPLLEVLGVLLLLLPIFTVGVLLPGVIGAVGAVELLLLPIFAVGACCLGAEGLV